MSEPGMIRTRWAAVGAAVAISMGAGGVGLASATISSGERPVFVAIEPCRLSDTRPAPFTVGPRSEPLGPDETYTLQGRGSVGDCTLPNGATALALNVTAVGATQPTFLTLFPGRGTPPTASNLNPIPGQPATPNAVTVDLAQNGEFSVFNRFGSVNTIIDVVGFFEHHHHDDRYLRPADADGLYLRATDADDRYAPAESDDGRVVCGPQDFTGGSGSANVKSSAVAVNTFCSVDLPAGARITRVSAVYLDQSAGDFGRCSIGATDFATALGPVLGGTTETVGSSSSTQTIETTSISPRVVRDDHHYWFSCRLAPSVSLVAATVFYDFEGGLVIGPT